MESKIYDQYILKTVGNKHIKKESVYYDTEYENALRKELEERGLTETFVKELTYNSEGLKMCSIASSARIGYLSSKSVFKSISHFEKTDIKNGCCVPNYDGYDELNNVFFEFKCHEICSTSHDVLSKSYKSLLKSIYKIDIDDPKDLRFSHFGIRVDGDPLINKINFDFKQFLCHMFGLLTKNAIKNNKKPTLHYVVFIPDYLDEEITKFLNEIEELIVNVINQYWDLNVTTEIGNGKVKDFVNFKFEMVKVSSIKDTILESF